MSTILTGVPFLRILYQEKKQNLTASRDRSGLLLGRHTKEATIGGKKLLELPPKHDAPRPVEFSPEERAEYDKLHAKVAAGYNAVRGQRVNAAHLVNKQLFQIMSAPPPPHRRRHAY